MFVRVLCTHAVSNRKFKGFCRQRHIRIPQFSRVRCREELFYFLFSLIFMSAKKKKNYQILVGFTFGALYFFAATLITMWQHPDERVDNYIPFAVDCVDGKDVFIHGHKKPTFMCTKYQRNNSSLRSNNEQ